MTRQDHVESFRRLLTRVCPNLTAPLVRCRACGVRTLPRDAAGHWAREHGVRVVTWGEREGVA